VKKRQFYRMDTSGGVANNSSSTSTNASYRSSLLPKVISYGYKDFREEGDKRQASCKFCRAKISDVAGTTSNFVRHLKCHPEQ
jgi:hypothetical protein